MSSNRKLFHYYLTLVLTILGHSLFGQGWEFRYTQEDERYFVEDAIVDQDSSVYLVGRRSYYDPNGPYLQYAFMAKFSPTGSLDWIEDYPTGFIPQQYSTVLYETNPRSVVFEINDAGNLYLAFLNRGAAINEYEMVILEVNRSDGSMVFLNNTPFSPQNYTPNVIRKGEDDNFLVAGPIPGEDQDLFLRSYSVDGTLQWQSTYDLIPETHLYKVAIPIGDTEFIGQIFEKTPEGNYLLGASVYNSNDPSACYLQIVELNPNGNLEQVIDFAPYSMSANEVTDQILSIDVLHDNTFAVFRVSNHSTTNSAYYLTYFDDSGTVAWERTFADISEPTLDTLPKGNTFTNGLLVHPNNDLSYVTTSDSLLHVITIDQNGSALATQTYPFLEGPSLDSEGYLKATEDQGMIWFGTTEDRRAIIYKFGSDGSLEWKNRSTLNNLMSGVMTHILSLDDQSHILIIPENHALVGPSINAIKIDASGIIFENQLTGQVFADIDENCLLDSTDILLQNQILQLDHEFFGVHYVSTDATGSFQFGLPDGDFSLSLNNVGLAWDFCFGNPVTGSLGTGADTLLLDFPLFPIADCPELSVELYTTSIRNCNPGTYSVRYCNVGTIPAVDAYIEISFHDSLTIDSASIPWSNQVGNTFTFPVDTIGLWSCEEFVVHFTAPCNVDLVGQSFCSEAHIYPDTLCGASPEPYTGAFMEARADCQDSILYFFLENTGQSPTSQEIEYVIIEDAVLQMSDQMNFDPDQEEVIEVTPTGSTYWLIADQEPGAPGAAQPIIGVEGCTNGDPLLITTGILNQFPYNDADPYLDIDCSVFRTAYDPNDKVASPVGYGPDHFIEKDQKLDYTIRFQNTGNDTAFTVIIRDTLSPHLNILSLQPGQSSHPYEFDVYGNRILQFTFSNILLPDSTTNEAASQGFVRYYVEQMPDNPNGTRIENNAGIYFDLNPPIVTNTTWHTVGENYILINQTTDPGSPNEHKSLCAYPNPFVEMTHLDLPGTDFKVGVFSLYSPDGRLLRQHSFSKLPFVFLRNDLSPGLYLLQLQLDDQAPISGKLVVGEY